MYFVLLPGARCGMRQAVSDSHHMRDGSTAKEAGRCIGCGKGAALLRRVSALMERRGS